MKKIKKSTGLTLALLIYVSATAAYLRFCYCRLFPSPQYGNQRY